MMIRKNEKIGLSITDTGINGEGVGRYEGCAFFVKDALPGDLVEAVVTKVNKGYGYAKTLKVLEPSPDRVEPACSISGKCGGCQLMPLSYEAQLKLKEKKVRNDLERIGGIDLAQIEFEPIMGMETAVPVDFRNKIQLPIGRDRDGHVVMGFYAGRTHCIINTDSCPVAFEGADLLINTIRNFLEKNKISIYDEKTGRGLVRHVLMRRGFATGQVMVCLVINGRRFERQWQQEAFVQALLDTGLDISCICLNINRKNTNVILGSETVFIYGNEYIEDRIGDLTFRISPLSFFQVNSVQTVKLYGKALEYAALTGNETVWDLYCGIGTISLFLAQKSAAVYGVEIVPQAIENARENAELNGIDNAEFFCGKSEGIFPEMCSGEKADVVVLDPPRKGCDAALLEAILEVAPERIVYVSCNSATLARDIKILSEKYALKKATPCDMFPHSLHCEVVCILGKN